MIIEEVWRQKAIPVIYRPRRGEVLCRTPYGVDAWTFLRPTPRSRHPVWHKVEKYWSLPHTSFNYVVRMCADRWGSVYVIQPHNEKEKCAPACWSAKGLECNCSCMGERHGSGTPEGRWYVIGDTCAVLWREDTLRISHLFARAAQGAPPPR